MPQRSWQLPQTACDPPRSVAKMVSGMRLAPQGCHKGLLKQTWTDHQQKLWRLAIGRGLRLAAHLQTGQ